MKRKIVPRLWCLAQFLCIAHMDNDIIDNDLYAVIGLVGMSCSRVTNERFKQN